VNINFASSDTNYNNAVGAGSLTISALVPGVASLSPVLTHANSGGISLTINGTNFVPGAIVNWNGSARATTFVSTSQLTASVTAADLATVGLANVTIFNPAPGGGTSAAFKFAIDTPAGTSGAVTASSTTSTLTVLHGQTATMQVSFSGANSSAQITATCFNLPVGASCSLSGTTVTITTSASTPAGSYQVIVVFTANQQITASVFSRQRIVFAAGLGFLGLPMGLIWIHRSRKKIARPLLVFSGLVLLVMLAGCGGNPKTTPATQQVTSQSSLAITLNVN
jgi:hypothetical protein